jgi:WD40 repeat protein
LDKTVRLWDAATGEEIVILRGTGNTIVCGGAFSPDAARIVTASYEYTVSIWDISSVPKGNLFQIACAWLPDHDLTGVARKFNLTNLAPICEANPPLPDHLPS